MVETGNSILLPCRVSPSKQATVTWTDGNGKLISGDTDVTSGRHVVLASGDLMIHHLAWDDMGEYTCTASNDNGQDAVKTFLYPLATEYKQRMR